MLRLFVGLSLPDGVIARLNIMCAGVPGAAWVEPSNMHITLRFIGEVEEHVAEEIDALLSRIEAKAFSLELAGVGTFGEGAKARSLWAAVTPSAALSHLQAFVEASGAFQAGPFAIDQFTLFESRLGKGSPIYVPLVDYPLE